MVKIKEKYSLLLIEELSVFAFRYRLIIINLRVWGGEYSRTPIVNLAKLNIA